MRKKTTILLATLLVIPFLTFHRPLSSQASAPATPTLRNDPAHPPRTTDWVETRLYFGLGPDADRSQGVSEATWRDFLDIEVTPHFPSGLSVVDVYGQWKGRQQKTTERERSKMLIVDYPPTPENAAAIEAIRTAWKRRTHAQSVLRVTEPVDVSF